MIVHEKTRAHAVEVMMSDKKAKHDLQHALALIGDRMKYSGTLKSAGEGGPGSDANNPMRVIKSLKRKVKRLEKKKAAGGGDGKHGDGKPTGKYIPPDVIAAIKEKGGKKSGQYLAWLYQGRNQSDADESAKVQAGKRTVGKVEVDVDLEDDDQEEDDKTQSASAAFGRESKNRHIEKPNPSNKQNKKTRFQKAVAIKSVHTLAATTTSMVVDHPSDHSLRCRAEIDSRADKMCAGAAFKLINESVSRVADVGGFHPDMTEMKNIPIGTVVYCH
jgi:hypothetical protein